MCCELMFEIKKKKTVSVTEGSIRPQLVSLYIRVEAFQNDLLLAHEVNRE